MRVCLVGVTMAAVLLGLACDSGSGTSSTTVTTTTQAGSTTSSVVDGKPTEQTSTTASGGVPSDETVRFQAADGTTFTGHLYSNNGPKRRLVIFAIPAPEQETAWQGLARELAGKGVAALTVQYPQYADGSGRNPTLMDGDLEVAVAFMTSREYPQIYIVGDLGEGTAAIKVAARRELGGIVTVSAPLKVGALDAGADIVKVSEPRLYILARNDVTAYDAYTYFKQNGGTNFKEQVLLGEEKGTALLQNPNFASGLRQTIMDFVSQ